MEPIDFSVDSNYKHGFGLERVRFGCNAPVLEVELNEMQQMQNENTRDRVRNIVGDGVYLNGGEVRIDTTAMQITFPKGTVFVCKGFVVEALEDMVNRYNYNKEITTSLFMYLDTFAQNDKLTYSGFNGTASPQPNYAVDPRVNEETSRRVGVRCQFSTTTSSMGVIQGVHLPLYKILPQAGSTPEPEFRELKSLGECVDGINEILENGTGTSLPNEIIYKCNGVNDGEALTTIIKEVAEIENGLEEYTVKVIGDFGIVKPIDISYKVIPRLILDFSNTKFPVIDGDVLDTLCESANTISIINLTGEVSSVTLRGLDLKLDVKSTEKVKLKSLSNPRLINVKPKVSTKECILKLEDIKIEVEEYTTGGFNKAYLLVSIENTGNVTKTFTKNLNINNKCVEYVKTLVISSNGTVDGAEVRMENVTLITDLHKIAGAIGVVQLSVVTGNLFMNRVKVCRQNSNNGMMTPTYIQLTAINALIEKCEFEGLDTPDKSGQFDPTTGSLITISPRQLTTNLKNNNSFNQGTFLMRDCKVKVYDSTAITCVVNSAGYINNLPRIIFDNVNVEVMTAMQTAYDDITEVARGILIEGSTHDYDNSLANLYNANPTKCQVILRNSSIVSRTKPAPATVGWVTKVVGVDISDTVNFLMEGSRIDIEHSTWSTNTPNSVPRYAKGIRLRRNTNLGKSSLATVKVVNSTIEIQFDGEGHSQCISSENARINLDVLNSTLLSHTFAGYELFESNGIYCELPKVIAEDNSVNSMHITIRDTTICANTMRATLTGNKLSAGILLKSVTNGSATPPRGKVIIDGCKFAENTIITGGTKKGIGVPAINISNDVMLPIVMTNNNIHYTSKGESMYLGSTITGTVPFTKVDARSYIPAYSNYIGTSTTHINSTTHRYALMKQIVTGESVLPPS